MDYDFDAKISLVLAIKSGCMRQHLGLMKGHNHAVGILFVQNMAQEIPQRVCS